MEKMRPIDAKLKYQVDRLLKQTVAEGAETEGGMASGSRPNPRALLEDDEEVEEEEGGRGCVRGGAAGVYRPPKLAATPYKVMIPLLTPFAH